MLTPYGQKSIGIDFRKNKSVSITAALIVVQYHPKNLRNLHRRLHSGHAETTGPNRETHCRLQ